MVAKLLLRLQQGSNGRVYMKLFHISSFVIYNMEVLVGVVSKLLL